MSISDNAQEIVSLVSQLEKELVPKKKHEIIEKIEKANQRIHSEASSESRPLLYTGVMDKLPVKERAPEPSPPEPETIQTKPIQKKRTSPKTKKKLMEELKINQEDLEKAYPKRKTKVSQKSDFTVYVTSPFGKISNQFFGKYVSSLFDKKNSFIRNLADSVRISGMPILSRTYICMMYFASLVGAMIALFLAMVVSYLAGLNTSAMIISMIISLIGIGILVFLGMYAYPASEAAAKSRAIDNDLPFATIHMAAVAGSGAQPIAMFRLLLKSGEYKGLESEIKKIVNLVNLFGYDLSTALKNVSLRTPSRRLKELLTGIASTIESGGSLKSYLKSVANESMATYRLERKKYVESLATYSDIYTGVLIAAPLLFIVALTIINMVGGQIGGLEVSTIAWGGTLIVLPIVNILFYLFLNITQPGE